MAPRTQKKDLTVSVVVSVYKKTNLEHFKLALLSILNQTYVPDELVLVFDGPTPEEIEKTANLYFGSNQKTVLKIVKYKTNKGLGFSLHKGVEKASSDLIVRMDDDDISVKTRIEQQVEAFKKYEKLDVIGGQIVEFDKNQAICKRSVPTLFKKIKKRLKFRNSMNHVTVCIKRDSLLKSGNYALNSNDGFEDYELWFKMIANGCIFTNLQNTLVLVRFDDSHLKRRHGLKYLKEEVSIHNHFLGKGYINHIDYWVIITTRLISRLLPSFILKMIYVIFLRNPIEKAEKSLFEQTMAEIKELKNSFKTI